ncbi:MAG: WD40 repeat domain-containing protein [bacterium]|nr:WD40 repeat domain-containing protein [bacterium]
MKRPVVVKLVILLVVGGLIGAHYFKKYSTRRAQERATEARLAIETETEALQIIDDLKAPPEAIHWDGVASYDIQKLRLQGFEKQYLHTLLPYANQMNPGGIYISRRRSPSGQYVQTNEYDWNLSLENYWLNASVHACKALARAFEDEKSSLHKYFKQRPELYKKEIRHRLLRLAGSKPYWLSLAACKALAAAGERSDFLRNRLATWAMKRSNDYYSDAVDLLKECGYAVPDLWPTLESLPAYKDDARTTKDAHGQLLPPGALRRLGRGLLHHGNTVTGVAFSPDGKLLVSRGRDYRVRVWDVATGHLVAERLFKGWAWRMALGPGGTIAALVGKNIKVWNLNDSTLNLTMNAGSEMHHADIAISNNGAMLAMGDGLGNFVQIYKLPSGKAMKRIEGLYPPGHSSGIKDMKFLPDNKTLVCGANAFCLVDTTEGRVVLRFDNDKKDMGNRTSVNALEDSTIVYIANQKVHLHNSDGTLLSKKPLPEGMSSIRGVYGTKLVMSGKGGMSVYDAKTMTKIRQISPQPRPGFTAISPDGRFMAITHGVTIRLWDTQTGSELHTPWRPEMVLLGKQRDGHTVYMTHARESYHDGIAIQRFDTQSGDLAEVTFASPDKVKVAAVSGDGKLLATYGSIVQTYPDSTRHKYLSRLVLWDLQTGQSVWDIKPARSMKWLRFNPSQSRLIAAARENGSHTGCTSVYDISRKELRYRLPLAMKAPPQFLFARSDDHSEKIRSPRDMEMLGLVKHRWQKELKAWTERNDMRPVEFNPLIGVHAAAPSRNGEQVATFSHNQLRFWELRDFRKEKYPSGPKLYYMCRLQATLPFYRSWRFTSAIYSPGDEFLLTTTSKGSSIIVWNKRGKPMGQITGHDGLVTGIQFVGDKLVSTSRDATLLVWDWPKIAKQFR